MINEEVAKAEEIGRDKFIEFLQQNFPNSKYAETQGQYDTNDLTVTGSTGQKIAVEIKYRPNYTSTDCEDTMFNKHKIKSLLNDDIADYGEGFRLTCPNCDYLKWYCQIWSDDVMELYDIEKTQPIREDVKMIKKVFVDPNSPKIPQERVYYSKSDAIKYKRIDDRWTRIR